MDFEFGGKSGLSGRKVHSYFDRFSIAEEGGIVEYIFAYKGRAPGRREEPDLYRDAMISYGETPNEIHLTYSGISAKIILVTLEEDDKFRKKHPDIVLKNELVRIDV